MNKNVNLVFKFIYSVFIGVLFSILVGVGIAAFYTEPKAPDYPSALKIPREGGLSSPVFQELKGEQEKYDNLERNFQNKLKIYNRNVSIIVILLSVFTLTLSLTILNKILFIADGLLLGGILTMFYAIGRGFGSANNKFQFIIVSVSFVVSIIVGYIKLIKPNSTK